MARVPVYNGGIERAGIPGAGFGVQATEAAMGGGAAAALGSIADATTRIAFEEKHKADQVAVLAAQAEHGAGLNEIENQVRQARGSAALARGDDGTLTLQRQALEQYDSLSDRIASKLTSDTQREAFQAEAARSRVALDGSVRNHVIREMDAYEEQAHDGFIANSYQAAVANAEDPARVTVEAEQQRAQILAFAKRRGVAPELAQAQADAQVSKTHSDAIHRLLAQGDDLAAKARFDQEKAAGLINGTDALRLEGAVQESSSRAESRGLTDQITATAPDLQAALTDLEGRKIADTDVYDRTKDRLVSHYALLDRAKRDRDGKLVETASDQIDANGGDWQKVDQTTWDALPSRYKASMRTYAAQVAKGLEPEDSSDRFLELQAMAANPATRKAYIDFDLDSVRGEVSKADRRRLVAFKREAIAAQGGTDSKLLAGIQTVDEVVKSTLQEHGILTSGKDADPVTLGAFYRQLNRRVGAAQAAKGAALLPEEVQKEADTLLMREAIQEPRGRWSPARLFDSDGLDYVGDRFAFQAPGAAERAYHVTQVPSAEIAKIRAAFAAQGVPAPSEAEVVRVYNAKVNKDAHAE